MLAKWQVGAPLFDWGSLVWEILDKPLKGATNNEKLSFYSLQI